MTTQNPQSPTSTSLLFRLKTQDAAAWERFVSVYGPLVMHSIRCHAEDLHLPTDLRDDIVQNVFIAVREYIGNFDRQRTGSFRTWLRKIVQTRVIDAHRAWQKTERTLSETEFDALHKIPEPTADESEEERKILFQAIVAAIARDCNENIRKIMQDTMIGDRSDAEVAAELGMTDNAVRQSRARIKKRIRDEFGDMMDEV